MQKRTRAALDLLYVLETANYIGLLPPHHTCCPDAVVGTAVVVRRALCVAGAPAKVSNGFLAPQSLPDQKIHKEVSHQLSVADHSTPKKVSTSN